jgi:hypothetical protein
MRFTSHRRRARVCRSLPHWREFIYTWWSGVIPDTFAERSLFRRVRYGRLRARAGGVRGMPVGGATPPPRGSFSFPARFDVTSIYLLSLP